MPATSFSRAIARAILPALLFATGAMSQPEPLRQTQADAYTRYELQAPDSSTFRIVYDVTATTPGARVYFNPIRQGSEAQPEHSPTPCAESSRHSV